MIATKSARPSGDLDTLSLTARMQLRTEPPRSAWQRKVSRQSSAMSAASSSTPALAARVVREVAELSRLAKAHSKQLATLSVDTEVRFRSAAEGAAFSRDLMSAVTTLAARYHDSASPGGRSFRLIVAAHPLPHKANSGQA